METTATESEVDAVVLSRMIRDGDRVFIGANLPTARCAALLAAKTHAPNVSFVQGLAWIDHRTGDVPAPGAGMDVDDAVQAEAWIRDYEAFDDVARLASFFVIGGFQIDQYGNTNLLGTPSSDGGWSRRGPGAVGTTTMATIVPRVVLYTRRHDPSVLVGGCDVISALGWAEGGTSRSDLGISTPGPLACVTPAGVFTFPEPHHRMVIDALRPGWTVESVNARAAFEIPVNPVLGRDPVPMVTVSDDELAILRDVVDTHGDLRR